MKEIEAVWSHLQNERSVTTKDCIIGNGRRHLTKWETWDFHDVGLMTSWTGVAVLFAKLSSWQMTRLKWQLSQYGPWVSMIILFSYVTLTVFTSILVVDYSCALQKDILVQGRLYISREFVCFYANIFRWETIVCSARLYFYSVDISY